MINKILEKISGITTAEQVQSLSTELESIINEVVNEAVKEGLSSIKSMIDSDNVDIEKIREIAKSLEQNLKDDVERANLQASIDARQDSTNKTQDKRLDFVEKKITENINNDFKRESFQKGINFKVEKQIENIEERVLDLTQKVGALSNIDLSKFAKQFKKLKVWCIVNSVLITLGFALAVHFWFAQK